MAVCPEPPDRQPFRRARVPADIGGFRCRAGVLRSADHVGPTSYFGDGVRSRVAAFSQGTARRALRERGRASVSARARPGRYVPYVHGYRSLSTTPILWALAGVAIFTMVFVLLLLVQTHRSSRTAPTDPTWVPSTVATAPPTTSAPTPTCFPSRQTPC